MENLFSSLNIETPRNFWSSRVQNTSKEINQSLLVIDQQPWS